MREGSVEVTGPGLKAPARVVGGQRLRANEVTADRPGEAPEVVVEDATTAAREARTCSRIAGRGGAGGAARSRRRAGPAGSDRRRRPLLRARDADRRGCARGARWWRRRRRGWRWPTPNGARSRRRASSRKRSRRRCAKATGTRAAGSWAPRISSSWATSRVSPASAEHAEMAYGRRCGATRSADRAVYGLGRLAFDQRKDYAAAESYFSETT